MMLESNLWGEKQLPLHTHDVDRQWVALNSHNEKGWTYFKNYIFVGHYSCRHLENEICQTSRPLAPSRLPLHARTFSSRERERRLGHVEQSKENKFRVTSFSCHGSVRQQITDDVAWKSGKNLKKWHTSRRWVCHWCFYHILTFSVIYYWTDPRQHGIYLFHTMIRKEKRSIHIPVSYRLTFGHDCSRICASLDIFKAHRYFSSLLLLFFFILLYTVSSNRFSTSFLAQSRIMAKTFAKQRISHSNDTRWQLLWRFLVV